MRHLVRGLVHLAESDPYFPCEFRSLGILLFTMQCWVDVFSVLKDAHLARDTDTDCIQIILRDPATTISIVLQKVEPFPVIRSLLQKSFSFSFHPPQAQIVVCSVVCATAGSNQLQSAASVGGVKAVSPSQKAPHQYILFPSKNSEFVNVKMKLFLPKGLNLFDKETKGRGKGGQNLCISIDVTNY